MGGKRSNILGRVAWLAIWAGVAGAPAALWAQSYDNPGLGEKPVAAHPQDFKPLGIRTGAFMLHPGVELAGEWTDNLFFSDSDEESDLIYHLRPYLTAQSNWSRHSLTVRLAADVARHDDYSFRDYEDYFLNIGGRFDVKSSTSLNYHADYMNLHEGLNVRSSEQGLEPTDYSLAAGGIGLDHQFNRLSVGLTYDHSNYDFDDTRGFDDEVIDNQDRDRDDDRLGLRLGYQFKTDMQAFVAANWSQVDFQQDLDRNDLNRNSDAYTLQAGVRFGITGVLSGDVFVSYHDASFDDPTLPGVDGWAAGMGLVWQPTQLTTVRGSISSDVQQTTNRFSSGYLGTVYSLRVDHELRRNLQLSAQVSFRDNDYETIAGAPPDARQNDEIWTAGLGATWFLNRSLFVSASYEYNELSSNVPGDGFDVNRVWLVLGLEK
ncbi:MAG: outer membrane beta-barrel protein [Xanthomonadales bacterium]|nr:outer membrane beta-barrel protein [Xanthomonadales bacterium]